MGSLYRRLHRRGTLEKGKRCGHPAHAKADTCPGCEAHFTGPFWVKYYRNGRPIRESTGTPKETEAKTYLKRREGDIASGRPVSPKAGKVRVEELLDDLVTDYRTNGRKSLDGVERIVVRLKVAFGYRRAHDLSASDVRAYTAKRQEEKAENATINRELAALKRAFNLALKDEKILRKPHIPMLAEHNVRTGFLGEIEYLALREALPDPLNSMLVFGYTYGWRKSEVLGLTWDRVDLRAGTARLDPGTTKNREGRTVVLTDELRGILRRLWEETRTLAKKRGAPIPWVFYRDGEPVKDFRGAWETACKAAGVPDLLFHDLRRSAVRRMERAGVSRSVAMKLTGHKTENVYRRYAIVSEGDLSEATKKLGGGPTGDQTAGTIPGTIGHSQPLPDFVHDDNPA